MDNTHPIRAVDRRGASAGWSTQGSHGARSEEGPKRVVCRTCGCSLWRAESRRLRYCTLHVPLCRECYRTPQRRLVRGLCERCYRASRRRPKTPKSAVRVVRTEYGYRLERGGPDDD